jgi:hypothetical protein
LSSASDNERSVRDLTGSKNSSPGGEGQRKPESGCPRRRRGTATCRGQVEGWAGPRAMAGSGVLSRRVLSLRRGGGLTVKFGGGWPNPQRWAPGSVEAVGEVESAQAGGSESVSPGSKLGWFRS